MRKSLLATAMAVGLAASAFLTPALAETKELRIGTISAAGSPWSKAMDRFSQVLAEKTDGELKAVTFTDGQLGDIKQMLTGMQLGNVEMGYFGLGGALFLKGAGKISVIYVPYLFRDREHAENALNSEKFLALYDEIAKETGVRIVGAFGTRTPRAIQSTRGPVVTPEDLKGMKLRIPGLPIFKATFAELGVQVVPMSMTEIYTGMSKGLVEGQDNGLDLALPLKFHEVAKHWSATDHAYEMTGWFISEKLWQSMNADQQAAVVEAAREGGKITTAEEAKLGEEAKKIFEEAGVTYTEPDRDAFRAALSEVHKQFDGEAWPNGFIEEIKAMK